MRLLPVLLVLWVALPAQAQKVVILEIDGDSGRLRAQVEAAVVSARTVELVSLTEYLSAAAKQGVKSDGAMRPGGIARAARGIRIDAAVGGAVVADEYQVIIYARTGEELWQRRLTLTEGLLSDDFASKLARAIAAAGEQGTSSQQEPDVEASQAETAESSVAPAQNPPVSAAVKKPPASRKSRKRQSRVESPPVDDSVRDGDLDADEAGAKVSHEGEVPLIRGWLVGTTTWRAQCLTPGVTACKDYARKVPQPQGIVIEFNASVPYLGVALGVELNPLARFNSPFSRGITLLGAFHLGQSLTRIDEETTQGSSAPKFVSSVDLGWSVQLAYRLFFAMGYGSPQPLAFVGLRGGLEAQLFTIDATARTPLPSSQRVFPTGFGSPVFGIDASVPIASFFRIDVGASLLLNPRPADEQVIGYGSLEHETGGAQTSAFGLEGGFSGIVWGPLGWTVRASYMRFADRYFGQGNKWIVCDDTQCGGAGEETFVRILWGVTGSL